MKTSIPNIVNIRYKNIVPIVSNERLIESLEEALNDAKSGELASGVFAGKKRGEIAYFVHSEERVSNVLGLVKWLETRIIIDNF